LEKQNSEMVQKSQAIGVTKRGYLLLREFF